MDSVNYWVVDSGSSNHIMSKKSVLVKLIACEQGNVHCVGKFGNITGMGEVINNKIFLENVKELVEFRNKQVWEILVVPNSHSTTRTKWVFK